MLILIVFTGLTIWGVAATVLALRSDGYGRRPTEWSMIPDRDPGDRRTPGVAPRHRGSTRS